MKGLFMTKWIVQNNSRIYDALGAFLELVRVDWRQVIKAEVGDVVYIYVAAPMKAIRLKCKAVEVNLASPKRNDGVAIYRILKEVV